MKLLSLVFQYLPPSQQLGTLVLMTDAGGNSSASAWSSTGRRAPVVVPDAGGDSGSLPAADELKQAIKVGNVSNSYLRKSLGHLLLTDPPSSPIT